ncbi:MAG: polymer-forming cytoskeletal protein [Acidobacteria bacterium]|nr:polymer-forming cytoskeletal protein [Acidobacteriota bacterium]MBS1864639.1 polymer-forming cytoskeletal protein [Acidobacteriota bacterium]
MTPSQGTAQNHLDEMTLLLFLERQLDRERAAEVSSHMQECGDCTTLFRALDRESRLLTRAMLEEEESLPARLASFQQKAKRSMQWIWMVTFGLAATGVYAIYTSYVEPVQNRLQDAGFGGTNLLGLLVFQGAFWKGWQSMLSLVEILAFLVVGVSAALLFRRWFRRGTLAALLVTGMCGALMIPVNAAAFESRKGETVEVSKDESIKGDILLTGNRIVVDGNVDGDVYAFGQDVEVNGHITGDLISGSQTTRVNGTVDGNVRGFVNTVTVAGNVGRNLMAWAQVVNVDSKGKVGRSLTSFCQSLGVDGQVGGDVVSFNQSTRIAGTIDGGLNARGELLTIKSKARITGPVKFEGEKEPRVEEGAVLTAGPVSFTKHMPNHREGGKGYLFFRLLWTCSFILYGMVLTLLMPRFAGDCVSSAENAGPSLGIGLLILLSTPIAAGLACFTFVGLPLGILTLVLWLVLLFSAQIVFGSLLGRWILGPTEDTWGRVGRMALGMAILGVAVIIVHQTNHWIEFFFKMALMIWGIGAISLTIYKRLQRSSGAIVAPPMVA